MRAGIRWGGRIGIGIGMNDGIGAIVGTGTDGSSGGREGSQCESAAERWLMNVGRRCRVVAAV